MRYRAGLVVVLALVAWPLRASAQAGERTPAIQLEAEPEGADLTPTAAQTASQAALEKANLKVKRARIGLISTAAVTVVGGVFVAVVASNPDCWSWFRAPEWCGGVGNTGLALILGGAAGIITTGVMLGVRKRKLRKLRATHHEGSRRARWDLAGSRLVF